MMKTLLYIGLIFLISFGKLHCQYWQEQIVLQGNVITQCFDENEDVLFSSPMSNKKYAICKYSVEKDSIDKVLLVTNKPVNFIDVLSDGTIMAFQDYQLLRSTDKGESWEGIPNEFKITYIWAKYDLKEFNNSLILWEEKNHYISFDKGTTWRVLQYQDTSLIHIEPTFNECLVAVEPKFKSPVFSTNFGLTWEKTNLDNLQLIGFIYSEITKTLFARTFPMDSYFYKSTDGGKYWEKFEIPTDTTIKSYDVDSQGNILCINAKDKLYKFYPENNYIEQISSKAPFMSAYTYPYYGERYRTGLFLDKNDNIYYYDAIGFKFWKFDKEIKKWMDSVNVIHHDVHPYSFVRKGLTFSNRAEKLIVNAETQGFDFIDLTKPKLKSIAIPNGLESISEYYDLSPNGDLAFANYDNQYYDHDDFPDTIQSVISKYTYSKDSGFSRKWILSDTNNLYDVKKEYYLYAIEYDENNFSTLAFDSNNELTIIGNNKTITVNLMKNEIYARISSEFGNRLPDVMSVSPDGYKYAFFSDLYYEKPLIYSIGNQLFYRYSDTNNKWELIDSTFNNTNCVRVNKILFQTDGKVFLDGINDCSSVKILSSTNHGESWTKKYVAKSQDTSISIYLDNKDNFYYNLYPPDDGTYSYKNWIYWGDTCDVVATKCGDIFATIGNYDITKHIYSSDYGDSWIDYPTLYILNPYHPIKSNDKGDVYQGKDNYSDGNTLYVLYKFLREPNPKPHPLSDTTVYTIIVDVDESQQKQTQELRIYPNPASDYIEISVGAWHAVPVQNEIKIYNTFGQCVLSVGTHCNVSVQRIDVSGLPVGMYFVRIGNHSNLFVKY